MKPPELIFVQTTAGVIVSIDYLGQQRTIAEAQQVVEALITQGRSLPKADRDKIQLRKSTYKKFLEEFFTNCPFLQRKVSPKLLISILPWQPAI